MIRRSGESGPTARIWVTELGTFGGIPDGRFVMRMRPQVAADLDAEQTAILLQSGMPPGVIAIMESSGAASVQDSTWLSDHDLGPLAPPDKVVDLSASFSGTP